MNSDELAQVMRGGAAPKYQGQAVGGWSDTIPKRRRTMTKILLINNRRDFEVISKREDTRDRRDLNSFIDSVGSFTVSQLVVDTRDDTLT